METLEKLWKTQKALAIILGLILLPLTLAIIGFKIYMWFNGKSAQESLNQAQASDNKLANEEDALKKEADKSLAKANEAAKRIEDRHKDENVDMDWNKKRED